MSYWGWKPYVPVAARRKKAESAATKAKKAGATLSPIAASRGAIAKTFWGKAWCDNLERYSDFANRLPRGRTYLRNGSVIDLAIGHGEVRAQVVGSSLYRVEVRVAAVREKHWKAIGADCAGSIDSMVELLQGTFSKAVMQRLSRPGEGLFPAPKEIEFSCSCPDWASMCKHVAAVLYGVGARLDQRPELLFQLRCVDGNDLLAQAGAGVMRGGKTPPKARVLDESDLGNVFGIEMAEVATQRDSVRPDAGQGKREAGGSVSAASKVVAEASTKSTSASNAHAKVKRTAGAPSARATVTAKTPARTRRQGAKKENLAQPIDATRKTQAAPAGVAVKRKQKAKRKSRA
jgi:uncharacterized Zn finger protein